jgi:hypothetical protein
VIIAYNSINNRERGVTMMTIILLFIGFVFIMFQPMSNVYVEIITWLGFGFAGFMIDGITLVIYDKCKKNKKRRK